MSNTIFRSTKDFFFCNGKYQYTIHDDWSTSDNSTKKVYVISFDNEAPENCLPGIKYCLIKASITFPVRNFNTPQLRHFWDFFPFEGDNIRQILASNDDVEKMLDAYNKGELDLVNNATNGDVHIYNCAVIEPLYKTIDLRSLSMPHQKIDFLLQVISGLKQLMSSDIIKDFDILAHRDLKLKNVVVDENNNFRLIDFPSIKVVSDDNSNSSNKTILGCFSRSNTAPEDVMSKYQVSDKTDVFALGCMLAEVFEIWNYYSLTNPLPLIYHKYNVNIAETAKCAEFFNLMNETYPFASHSQEGWLERALSQRELYSNWSKTGTITSELQYLFRSATAIDPKNRISLDEFEELLISIKSLISIDIGGCPVMEPKKSYFLIDRTNLHLYIDEYKKAAKTVLESKVNFDVVVIDYCSVSKLASAAQPSDDELTFTSTKKTDTIDAFYDSLDALGAYISDPSDLSRVKGCLYELSRLLEHSVNREAHDGEIHIFAPKPPIEDNMQKFMHTTEQIPPSIEFVDGPMLKGMLKSDIYVHAPSGETEEWYTLCPLSTDGAETPPSNQDNNNKVPNTPPSSGFKPGIPGIWTGSVVD